MRFDVVGLGVATVDLILVVDDFPGGETVQRAHASIVSGGGPVATAMVALARLGGRSAMLDRIGDDLFGRMILEEFAAEGVDRSGMVLEQGRSSSKASILVRKRDGARAITFSPGDSGELAAEMVREEMIRASRILHLNGRHLEASLHAVRVARDAGVLVSFDGGAHRFDPSHKELIPKLDICIVAQEYAASATGENDPGAAARVLLAAGPRLVVITQGSAGSLVYPRDTDSFHQEAFRVADLVDTTGAGDAYHGAFLFGLARGYSLRDSARLAAVVGALNTRALGGRAALPTLDEAETFLK